MSVEQAHQRLGIAEDVIHELQEQLQRVSAGHQAMHQELSNLRGQVETRSRIRLVEPKTLMPDRFGKKNGPSWRTWYLARDFVGMVHGVLKQAMKTAENRKIPIAVTNLQHDFGVTNEMDQELQHFLISRTEGEALETVRGAEREPGLEQWRRLAALYDPLAAGRSLDDSRQILSPPKVVKIDDLSHTIQTWENLEQRHRERTGDQLPKDMRLAILLSMCPTDLEKGADVAATFVSRLRANEGSHRDSHQQPHPRTCPDDDGKFERRRQQPCCQQSRHRMNLSKVKMVNYTAWKSGTARKFSPSPLTARAKDTPKEEGKAKLTENAIDVDALVTSERTVEPKSHINGGPPKSAPKGKGVASCEDEETETSQNVPLGTIDLASFEVLSYHGDDVDDEVDVDVSTNETTEMMPPLPLISWLKKTEAYCGKFRKLLQ